MLPYRAKTTEDLIKEYAWEAGRENEQDRKTTQKNIKAELQRRFTATIALLDDPQTTENPEATFNYLLGK